MIEDDVIREVRTAREAYAALHGYNIRAMVADLQAQDLAGDWPVVSYANHCRQTAQVPIKSLQPTGAAIANSQNAKSPEAAPTAEIER